jgi:hypothetical protein
VPPFQLRIAMKTRLTITLLALVQLLTSAVHAQRRVNPAAPYAYGANTGWLHAAAATGTSAVRIGPCVCTGYIYSANCGWINLGDGTPQDGQQYSNTDGNDSGVNVLPDGKLRGLAWGAAIGWINFEATGNPRIDPVAGNVAGYAWSAGTGWISFDTPQTDLSILSGDSDNDTIPDVWELSHAANLTVLAATKDSDGDGQNDAAEYAADTDPLDAASVLRITYLAMRHDLGAGTLRWTSTPTRSYRVEKSPDLLNWSPLAVYYGDDFGINSTSVPMNGPKHYFRVIALKPPAGE